MLIIIQYSRTIYRFGISCPQNITQNQLNIYCVTSRQDWLGIVKPKNVFRSTINPSTKLIWNFLTKFSTDGPTDQLNNWLTCLLMLSDKHNSILAIYSYRLDFFAVRYSFALRCVFLSTTAANVCIMVLPKLTFGLLCVPFFSPLPHRWRIFSMALWF